MKTMATPQEAPLHETTETDGNRSRHSRTLRRPDGSEVKIVATVFWSWAVVGPEQPIDVYVLHRVPGSTWRVCSDRPTPVKPFTVAAYLAHGRPESLRMAGQGQILKTIHELRQIAGLSN